jgi:hypothetical protein
VVVTVPISEYIGNACNVLDVAALSRQEDWEEPKGPRRARPQRRPHVRQLAPR